VDRHKRQPNRPTTSTAGNIVTYTPDSDYFMFRTASGPAPVRYYYTKDTTVVDPAGRVVSFFGNPSRHCRPPCYYSTVGDRVVVRKVVLAQPAQPAAVIKREETTTTTTTRP